MLQQEQQNSNNYFSVVAVTHQNVGLLAPILVPKS